MDALRVGLIGCGLMGRTRVAALGPDQLVAATDLNLDAAQALVDTHGAGQVVSVVTGPVATLLVITGHEHDAVAAIASSTVLHAALGFVCIPRWGVTGAAAAAAISLAGWNGILWWRVRRRLAIGPTLFGL